MNLQDLAPPGGLRLPDALSYDLEALFALCLRKNDGKQRAAQADFDEEVERRHLQDERCASLAAEVAYLDRRIAELAETGAQARRLKQAKADEAYRLYLAAAAAVDAADVQFQGPIAALQANSIDKQRQIALIIHQRQAERENRLVAAQNTSTALLAAQQDLIHPRSSPAAEPMSVLEQVNAGMYKGR